MIKQIFFTLLISINILAMDMPPMPPSIPNIKKDISTKNKKVTNSCDAVPPMLYLLPPPLKSALDSCIAQNNMPKKEFVTKYLKKDIKSIKHLKNSNLYKIDFIQDKKLKNINSIYCNSSLSVCFKTAPISLTK